MSEPTDTELRRISWLMMEAAQFGRSTQPEPPEGLEFPEWRIAEARAAYALGARHDGRGELHGPVRDLGTTSPVVEYATTENPFPFATKNPHPTGCGCPDCTASPCRHMWMLGDDGGRCVLCKLHASRKEER